MHFDVFVSCVFSTVAVTLKFLLPAIFENMQVSCLLLLMMEIHSQCFFIRRLRHMHFPILDF
jgi:hypothetical protein